MPAEIMDWMCDMAQATFGSEEPKSSGELRSLSGMTYSRVLGAISLDELVELFAKEPLTARKHMMAALSIKRAQKERILTTRVEDADTEVRAHDALQSLRKAKLVSAYKRAKWVLEEFLDECDSESSESESEPEEDRYIVKLPFRGILHGVTAQGMTNVVASFLNEPDSAKPELKVPTLELSSEVETEDERYLVDDEQHFAVPPVPPVLHPAPLHPRRQKWLARKPVAVGMTNKPSATCDLCRGSAASTGAEHPPTQAR